MVQNDDTPLALSLGQVHTQSLDHHFAHAYFGHRPREQAPDCGYDSDHRDGYQDQAFGRTEEIRESL